MMSRNIPTYVVALLVIVIIAFTMCAFQVRFTETAVVTQFDKIKRVIKPQDAGLHFKWPWPIDRVHRYDARLRSFETEFRQLGTQDQRTVVLTAYATWRIDDAEKLLKALGREEAAAQKIRDLLENQVSVVLRTHPLSHLVNVREDEMKLAEIEQRFLAGIKDDAEKDYGIEIVSVGIKRLGIPESVTKEVFTRMKEDRQKTIKQLKAEGEAEATKILAQAEEISKKIRARADAYAKTIEGQGHAEAARYYKIFAENRRLSDFLKKLETIRRIFEAGQITLVMDADKVVPFDVLRGVGKPAEGDISTEAGASSSGQTPGPVGASSDGPAAPDEQGRAARGDDLETQAVATSPQREHGK
ncbi:MAG: protease modulator HflC [Phycisphaerae bacterium]|nr:protease modulator HflC [Phycisphaerae bacterium]